MLHSLPGDLVLKAKPVFDSWRTRNSKDQNTCYHNKKPKSAWACIIFQNVQVRIILCHLSVQKLKGTV